MMPEWLEVLWNFECVFLRNSSTTDPSVDPTENLSQLGCLGPSRSSINDPKS